MEKLPEPAAIGARREIAELGVTVVRFANGVEAWLKPTDFKNDQVLFSLAAERRLVAGGPGQVHRGAAGHLAGRTVGRRRPHAPSISRSCWPGKIAGASPFITLSTQGISGSSTPANLETGLQLLNLNFTAPGDDPEAFALIKRQLEAAYANRDSNPNAVFGEKLSAVNTMNHYTARPLTMARIGTLDRAAMASVLPRPLRQRRRLHLLHGRRLQGGRGAAAGRALRRVAALDRDRLRASSRTSASRSRRPSRRRSSRRDASRRPRRS